MTSSSVMNGLGVWTQTYLTHSTLLLGIVWLLSRAIVIRSHALHERLWKLAAVGGVVTATLAVNAGWGVSIGPNADASSSDATVTAVANYSDASNVTNQSEAPVAKSAAVLSAEDAELLREASLIAEMLEASDAVVRVADGAATKARHENKLVDSTQRPTPSLESRFQEQLAASSQLQSDSTPLDAPQSDASLRQPPLASVSDRASIFERVDLIEQQATESVWRALICTLPRAVGTLTAVWIAFGVLRLLRSEWALWQVVRRSAIGIESASQSLTIGLLSNLAARARTSPPRLLFSADIAEPMACGVWHPTILLPEDIEARLNPDELRALLAHEFAHLQRGDVMWLWLGRVLSNCLGFQPLNAVARRAWQVTAEIQCDDWAVEHDVSAMSLASCLAQVAEWKLDRVSAAALAVTGSSGSLTVRIERLLADRIPDVWSTRWRSRMTLLAGFVIGLLFASVAPRLDESLWARSTDMEERLQLWEEIRSELEAAENDLDRLKAD